MPKTKKNEKEIIDELVAGLRALSPQFNAMNYDLEITITGPKRARSIGVFLNHQDRWKYMPRRRARYRGKKRTVKAKGKKTS